MCSVRSASKLSVIVNVHLIFGMVDDCRKFRQALRKVCRRQLALENGVLQVVAIVAHNLNHLAKPLVIADVVTNEIGLSHYENEGSLDVGGAEGGHPQ